MAWLIALILFAHAVAHLPGFVVPWQLMVSPEMPYKTTVLAGRLDVGDTGIRIVGMLWLSVALLFALTALAWVTRTSWAASVTLLGAVLSLAICLVEVPQAWIGVAVNVALLLATPVFGATAWGFTSDRVATALTSGRGGQVRQAGTVGTIGTIGTIRTGANGVVDRYFAHVLPPGQRPIATAMLEQEAEFFVGGGWKPLTARQHFVTEPPGFVWDARIAMAPGVPVFVRDSYIGGAGAMHGEVAGVFPIVRQSDKPELNAGALHRYVAEAVWLPTALWPGAHMQWTEVDDRTALATFTDAGTTVRLQFRFTAAGDVEEIHVRNRPREENGRYIPTPWTVRCQEWGTFDGIRVPVRCEVAWEMPAGPLPYWRGRITHARYTY